MARGVVGVDEAGRGPALGPLVVCAIYMPKYDREILSEIGVKDSKKLSKKRIEDIYQEIISKSILRNWSIGIKICEAEMIDKWMTTGNLNSLEVKLFSDAISKVTNPSNCPSIFLDACDVNEVRFGKNVMYSLGSEWSKCDVLSMHKLDENDVLVAAASVIAKKVRDDEVKKLSKQVGMNLGSGYPADPSTKIAIRKLCNFETPHKCLRWSWANVRRTWIEENKRPMPKRVFDECEKTQSVIDDWKQ